MLGDPLARAAIFVAVLLMLLVASEFTGATLEEYLLFLGRRFFQTWDHVHTLRLSGRARG